MSLISPSEHDEDRDTNKPESKSILPQLQTAMILQFSFVILNLFAMTMHDRKNRRQLQNSSYEKPAVPVPVVNDNEPPSFLAHEIRNPLHALLALADSCLQDLDALRQNQKHHNLLSKKSQKEAIETALSIKENLQGIKSFEGLISGLINGEENTLTEPSSSSGSKKSNIPNTINLRTLLQKNFNATNLAMKARGITFTTQTISSSSSSIAATNLPEKAQLDSTSLLRILSNLYSNASKFTPAGGSVDVLVNVLEEVEGFDDVEISGRGRGYGIDILRPRLRREEFDDGFALYMFPQQGNNDGAVLVRCGNEVEGGDDNDDEESCSIDEVDQLFMKFVHSSILSTQTKKPTPTETNDIDASDYENTPDTSTEFTSDTTLTEDTRYETKYLQISVRDTGPGIPQEAMRTLFDPFTQASVETVRMYGGSGLGLAIVRGCLEKMKGVVVVESVVGGGTRFTLTVPIVVAKEC
ncbi:Histidine kinase osmosensor [Blyttiomyces sp. JEL0837]|nr:Histidine kinase osmosensor [Blyttiomyces sp. JEL0837]